MRRRSLLLPLLLLAPLTACGGSGPSDTGVPTVVVGAYPFQWLAEHIGGDDAHVVNLVKPGVEPHDVELSPKQVGQVQTATLVVYLKGFQPAVDDAVGEAHNALDLGKTVKQRRAPAGEDSAQRDPHVWLDPVLMQQIADAITDRLSELRPAHRADFEQRNRALTADLTALDADVRAQLVSCARTEIVTSHAAFGYFAARYDLVQRGITGLNPDAEPSPRRLAEVATFARAHHVTTIFFESLVSPKVARTVAAEIGARTAVLDPIESVRGTDDYASVMRRNAATLHTALGCS